MSRDALSPQQFPEHSGHPPYFTGQQGPEGGPMWQAPTHEYMGPMEVHPAVHALTEAGGHARYTSSIFPTVQISAAGREEDEGERGHYVSVQQRHPGHVADVRERYPKAGETHFHVDYWHGADEPALEGTEREDMRDLFGAEAEKPGMPNPVTHRKTLYRGDDPREAQKAAVEASMRIRQATRGR